MAANPDKTHTSLTSNRNHTLPYVFAKRHGVLVEENADDHVKLIHRANASTTALLEARRALGKPMFLQEVADEAFDALLIQSYESDSGQAMDIIDDLGDELDLARLAESMPEPEDLMESEDNAPVIRLINAMLTEATRKNASDIHIEPFENRLNIRFRIDGVMQDLIEPPRAIAPLIISRIKVMAKLDIAEKRLPQDGRISLRVAGRPVDVRVATLPSGHGERVVLRLLDKQSGRLDLEHLGMNSDAREHLDKILQMPHGIMLVTGPTGSGKTTSLYAAITKLNTQRSTILTIEDPIEYYLDGVGQTQVNTKVKLDFARGLRAILRQDPDIVMVGEIRDLETADTAVQASLTGHLVLSTLHTNSAVGAVARLRDMGVEPFLLSSSLIGVVAQRLIRVLCTQCRRPHKVSTKECEILGIEPQQTDDLPNIYAPVGCAQCNNTGYLGRRGIYEVVPIDDKMRSLIHEGASETELEQHARSYTSSIIDDARRRVRDGETALEEILRVTRDAK